MNIKEQITKMRQFCYAKRFDLLRKPPPTVSLYADGCGLLVLKAPLTSVSMNLRCNTPQNGDDPSNILVSVKKMQFSCVFQENSY